jgi:hypothetical protein
MERIAKTHQPARIDFIGNHTGGSSAERLSSDYQFLSAAEFFNAVAPGLKENSFRVRGAAFAGFPPPLHVRKFKPENTDAERGHPFGDTIHKWRIR